MLGVGIVAMMSDIIWIVHWIAVSCLAKRSPVVVLFVNEALSSRLEDILILSSAATNYSVTFISAKRSLVSSKT